MQKSLDFCCVLLLVVASALATAGAKKSPAAEAPPSKIVILAGAKSHGPEGNGTHEYPRSARLLKTMLDNVEGLRGKIVTEIHYDGWPKEPATLNDAATIMTISDGQDGDQYSPVPWMTPERILNALAWTAGLDVPEKGIEAKYYTDDEVKLHLAGGAKSIKAIIVTGNHHPAHTWRETTLALEDALRQDPRIDVVSIPDPEFLASEKLHDHDTLVLNYCNWEQPGLSDAAKQNFVKYLSDGGGLVIVHFANGAFHYSLPKAADSDWPEYRQICRRVWNHEPSRETKLRSGHDAYGKFRVEIVDKEHAITRGLPSFETIDELYYQQDGSEPIHVLAAARSKDTGKDEPQALVYEYGKGRVFQTVLGHAPESIRTPGTSALFCRGAAWTAGREPIAVGDEAEPTAAP